MKLKHNTAYLTFCVQKNKETKEEWIVIEKEAATADVGDDYLDAFIADMKGAKTCRFGVVDWNKKLCFVAWSPESAKGKDKMVYASIREGFIQTLVGVQIKLQATDDAELSKEAIVDATKSNV
eukprot:CAMPEP_0202723218 /NCGR_PEP_ID=MMETSP1385-20130828/164023_1 /ASSEMBLY_ACC=CAM_ASM_000861 /TAXON_ID=933848 /ORGANISM="Elphidium margaritaceum" /LENGTH=122 /DNA_ID=CAMNT_0049388257 /DNA_START=1 /DNA_END=369 /DNA_ORIENTATION=-